MFVFWFCIYFLLVVCLFMLGFLKSILESFFFVFGRGCLFLVLVLFFVLDGGFLIVFLLLICFLFSSMRLLTHAT